jgi:anti-anti-sigma factor
LQQNERTAKMTLSGDLDVYRRDEIAAAFPAPDSVDRLVIDMRGAGVLDSSVIAVLMRYRRSFIEAGGDPREIVIVVPPNLRRIFEITGLVTLLTIVTGSLDADVLDKTVSEA